MAYAGEVFAQLLTVQAYAQEEGELRRYSRLLGEADSKQQVVTIFHKGWTAGFHLLTNSAMVLAACYAGTLASRGQLEPSSLVSFTQVFLGLSTVTNPNPNPNLTLTLILTLT